MSERHITGKITSVKDFVTVTNRRTAAREGASALDALHAMLSDSDRIMNSRPIGETVQDYLSRVTPVVNDAKKTITNETARMRDVMETSEIVLEEGREYYLPAKKHLTGLVSTLAAVNVDNDTGTAIVEPVLDARHEAASARRRVYALSDVLESTDLHPDDSEVVENNIFSIKRSNPGLSTLTMAESGASFVITNLQRDVLVTLAAPLEPAQKRHAKDVAAAVWSDRNRDGHARVLITRMRAEFGDTGPQIEKNKQGYFIPGILTDKTDLGPHRDAPAVQAEQHPHFSLPNGEEFHDDMARFLQLLWELGDDVYMQRLQLMQALWPNQPVDHLKFNKLLRESRLRLENTNYSIGIKAGPEGGFRLDSAEK